MTLDEIQVYVRSRLGISARDQNAAAKTVEMTVVINGFVGALVLRHRLNQDVTTLTPVADGLTAALPPDFGAIRSLYAVTGRLEPVTWDYIADLTAAATVGADVGGPRFYVLESLRTVRLWPAAHAQLTLFYVPAPALLQGPTDTPEDIPGPWHLLVCERTVEWMAASEEALDLAADARGRADVLEAQLAEFVQTRAGLNDHRIPLVHYHR